MRLRISIRGCVRPSVRRSVRPSVCPVLFSNDEYGRFLGKKSLNNINDTMSEDELVASDVPPRYLLPVNRSKEVGFSGNGDRETAAGTGIVMPKELRVEKVPFILTI